MAKKQGAGARRAKTGRKSATRSGGGGRKQGVGLSLQAFCRGLPGTTEDVKWGDDLVFSVGGKMYAAFDLENPDEMGFKCDDDDFERLTGTDGIIPAPYAARFGWVKVQRGDALPLNELRALIRKSHAMVAACLPRRVRDTLGIAGE